MRLLGCVGNFSSVALSHASGSMPLVLAVASRLWMAAACLPARAEPAKSQSFPTSAQVVSNPLI